MFYVLTKVSFPVSYECHSIFSSLVFVGLCPHTDYSPPDPSLFSLLLIVFRKSSLDSRDSTHVRYLLNIHARGLLYFFLFVRVFCMDKVNAFYIFLFFHSILTVLLSQLFAIFISYIFSIAHMVSAEVVVRAVTLPSSLLSNHIFSFASSA